MGYGGAGLGDGVGALCPSCPRWFRRVDEAWREHVSGEHPSTWARLRAAARSSVGAERTAVRGAMGSEASAIAEQIREHRRPAA